ncbi:MAG: collagen-like triple helix repeat-containing protein, partial [Trinickia sp.]
MQNVGGAVSTLGNGISQGLGQLGSTANPIGTTLASAG